MIMQELVSMTSGIYIVTNKLNGRRYIGYSENIEQRWEINIDELNIGDKKRHQLMLADWKNHGHDAYCFGILEVIDTKEESLLSKRARYWRNLLQPEYNGAKATDGCFRGQQAITNEFAILAPVPLRHLESGLETCREHGKVAFGSMGCEFFKKVDSKRGDKDVSVFIYASLAEQSIGAKVSWQAVYTDVVDAQFGKHPLGGKYRPETTKSDGAWNFFWEVRDLCPLPKPMEISTLRGYSKKSEETYKPNFVPLKPMSIEYPPLL